MPLQDQPPPAKQPPNPDDPDQKIISESAFPTEADAKAKAEAEKDA